MLSNGFVFRIFLLGGKTLWMRKIKDEKEINFAINQNFLHFKLFF